MSSGPPSGIPAQQQQPQLAPPITIAVMGATGSGKTSLINMGSGSNLRTETGLESCTAEVQPANEFALDGHRVLLVDTPGSDNTDKSDTDILKMIAAFLATTYEGGSKLAGVIYLHRISDKRFTGIAGHNLKMFRQLCGDSTLKNVIFVTTMWGQVSPSVGEAREQELVQQHFKLVLDKGAQLARYHDTPESAHDIIRRIMKNQPVTLRIQRELVDEGKDIIDTAAGRALNLELGEQIARHQAELKANRKGMRALIEKDGETHKIQEEINQMRIDSEGMTARYNEEKRRMEQAEPQPVPPITIAVMGAGGSGKTSFINMSSGSNLRVGKDSKPCTTDPHFTNGFTLDGQRVLLVDMPSFDDVRESDADTLKLIAASLATTYENGSKLTGIIYIHRISDKRITRVAERNFRMLRELCGDPTLKNVILVTNMWGEVSPDVGEAREQELVRTLFEPALDKSAQLVRHYNTAESAHDIIRCVTKNQPIVLRIQRELVDEGKDIIDTAAGQVVNKEFNEQIARHQVEVRVIREEMLQALKQNDEETRREMQEEMHRIYEYMNKMRMDSDGMAAGYNEEKWRMEEAVRQIQEEARQERERADAEYRRRMDDLNERLQRSTNLVALLNGRHHDRRLVNPQRTGGSA